MSDATGGAPSPERRAELRRVADALRAVIRRFVATRAPIEVFTGVADELESVAARLAQHPQDYLFFGVAEGANAGDSEGPFDNSPFVGLSNPLAPPARMEMLADRVVGSVVCSTAYEGPPGCVHGGVIAGLFDELLGFTQSLSGRPGMTGRLVVHYRSPTPLNTELQMEGRLASVSGRKILCHGWLKAGGTLCAEAEGLFISLDPERFAALREEREQQVSRSDPAGS